MKKIILSILVLLLFTQTTYAVWYENVNGLSWSLNSWGRDCGTDSNDGDDGPDPKRVALNNAASTIPHSAHGSTIQGKTTSWTLKCLYWDATAPVVSILDHFNGWTNQVTETVNFTFTDSGGSNLSQYTLQRRIYSSGVWSSWADVPGHINRAISTGTYNGFYTYTSLDARRYQFRAQVRDRAGNVSPWIDSWETTFVDKTAPSLSDVSIPSLDLLANSSYSYVYSIGVNGWSPINSIQYQRENRDNEWTSGILSDTSSPWGFSWDISKVDNFVTGNGWRMYTTYIRSICDLAWNCWTWNNGYNHFVYANTVLATTTSIISNDFSSSIIADGGVQNIVVALEDTYGNNIVPATWISRTIDISVTTDNALRKDQYINTWIADSDSALFIGNANNPFSIGANSQRTITSPMVSGNYAIPFYVFAPTYAGDNQMPWFANITDISFDVNSSMVSPTGANPQNIGIVLPWGATWIEIEAEPLYTTLFTSDSDLKVFQFQEWQAQSSKITVSRNPFSALSGTAKNIYLEYGWPNTAVLDLTWNPINASSWAITEIQDRSSIFQWNTGFIWTNKPLETFLSMNLVWIPPNIQDAYLATIVRYTIGGKNIIYPSDIINKPAYHSGVFTWGAALSGLRVIWNTSSQSTQETVANQFSNDLRILGKLTKSTFRKDIQRKVYEIIRNLTPKLSSSRLVNSSDLNSTYWSALKFEYTSTLSQGISVLWKEVLYFWDINGNNVTLQGTSNIEWNKTIVVEWGNIYITSNIRNSDSDGMLGLIALRKDGQGGNIYIHPSVTDIHAIMYTDRSVISYDGTKELDGNNTSPSQLSNQLYIRGSIFSENTIGASRASPSYCPFYVDSTDCTSPQEAQKYDLNYLRRYFIYDSTLPTGIQYDGTDDAANLWQESLDATGVTDFRKYPIIIEYNSAIQHNALPFFH